MAIQVREQSRGRARADGELAAALRAELRGAVRADPYTRHLYASDASMYARDPLLVAFPRDAADVAAAIAIAGHFDVPVITRGAGTSLAGQTVGAGGLVLDTSRHMDAIGEIDTEQRRVRVGPGVVQEDLNRAAHRLGFGFGPDTSTSNRATIGGMIGNNSSGSHSIVYGTTIDHVHELDVVLADGATATLGPDAGPERLKDGLREILRDHAGAIETGYPKHWRQSGGYRLDSPRARLQPRQARHRLGGHAGRDHRGHRRARAAAEGEAVRGRPLPLAGGRDRRHRGRARAERGRDRDDRPHDPRAQPLQARVPRAVADDRGRPRGAAVRDLLRRHRRGGARTSSTRSSGHGATHGHGYHTLRAESPHEQEAITKVRKAGLGLLMAASSGARRPLAFVEDTAVAPERLNDYVAAFKEILDRHGLNAGWYGHCSVGCLHIRPFVDLTEPGGIETMSAVAEEIVDLVAAFDGVNSSEHGDGRVRSAFNRRIFGDELYDAFREVKALFDPHNRLNPGVMVEAAPLTEDLRDPALPPPGPIETHLHFPDGMRAAADRCQRIGACRKTGIGVMCPSYMATREEEHATRGRANALVKALSEPDPKQALGDERLHEILDLCLECKACKSECPLSVDMASLKAEFLSHYQDAHGVPLRSRLFGSIRALNRIGAATAPLSNLAPRRLLERAAGIDRRRPLPRFQRDTLIRWDKQRTKLSGREVVFLADSFTTFTEPAIGRAAIELLEAAGYAVRLESAGCCGRSSISKGLLDRARAMAESMTERLAPYAERGVPIVGCEPSCLLTLKEEHLSLQPGNARAQTVADHARLVEELLVEAIDDGSLQLDPGSKVAGSRIVFHGHCHQKALAGTKATVELLERVPGAEVVELDAGCCGMAGSFGFETEHYELSMQIGELRLFPALRREAAGTLVAATGVSCRQQISHGVGREARHPVQIVREAL